MKFEVGKLYAYDRSRAPTSYAQYPDCPIYSNKDDPEYDEVHKFNAERGMMVLSVDDTEAFRGEPLPRNASKIKVLTYDGQVGWMVAYYGPGTLWTRMNANGL